MSFVPVKVEINVGETCIGILPVRLEANKGIAYADMFRAECIAVKDNGGERECEMDFTAILGQNAWVSDYRITDFSFGGVMIGNPKFDPMRIDSEDEAWLKKALAKVKSKNSTPRPKKTP